ncbi:HNH endonuclease [Ralstonia sp. CP]|uniref:HNH endonuclease n=1 Tax=Ralstonia sp. CP TaxID=3231757 RepID=UPI00345C0CFB
MMVEEPMLIYTAKGEAIKVSAEDYEYLSQWKWHVDCRRRAARHVRIHGKRTQATMHRQIMGLATGDKRHVDHINGDTLDNRRSNLRVCSHSDNQHNKGAQRNNKCGIKNVRNRNGKWCAEIRYKGKLYYLGNMETIELAEECVSLVREMIHGEFANHKRRTA